jgi:hypothetical protein
MQLRLALNSGPSFLHSVVIMVTGFYAQPHFITKDSRIFVMLFLDFYPKARLKAPYLEFY